jgi:hypothetical protein
MTVLKMPDGAVVDFGSRSDDEIRGMIESKFPDFFSGQTDAPSIDAAPAVQQPFVDPGPEAIRAANPEIFGDPQAPAGQAESTFDPGRALTIGAQGVGRGIANTVAAPTDIPNALLNLLIQAGDSGAQAFGGEGTDFRFGMNSDVITSAADDAARSIGIDTVNPADMSLSELIAYKGSELGTEALGLGGLTAGRATQTLAKEAPGFAAKVNGPAGAAVPPGQMTAGDRFAETFGSTPRTQIGDVAQGVGAGAGAAVAQDLAPDSVLAQLVGTLAGGFSGGAARDVVASPQAVADSFKGSRVNEALSDRSGTVITNRVAGRAAGTVQAPVRDPKGEADIIRANRDQFLQDGGPVPTTAGLAQDPGFIGIEQTTRAGRGVADDPAKGQDASKLRADILRRDQEVITAAGDNVRGIRPEDVDAPGVRNEAFRTDTKAVAGESIAKTRSDAENLVRQKEQDLANAQELLRQFGEPIARRRESAGDASAAVDRLIVDETLKPLQAEKNARFESVDPNREFQIDTPNLNRAPDAIDARTGDLPTGVKEDPNPTVDAIRRRNKQRDLADADDTGDVLPPEPLTVGGLVQTRANLKQDQASARAKGEYARADNIKTLTKAIDSDVNEASFLSADPAAKQLREAKDFHKTKFAPFFGRGAGKRLKDEVNADDVAGSSRQRSQTLRKHFITASKNGPDETARDLREIIDISPDPKAGVAAVREYILANAVGVLNPDNSINNRALHNWMADRSHLFKDGAFPEVKRELDGVLTASKNGEAMKTQFGKDLDALKKELNLTDREIDRSAFSTIVKKSPENTVGKVFGDGDPVLEAEKVTRLMKDSGNPRALAGWKAAVVDHLVGSVATTNVGKTTDGSAALSKAKFTNVFKKNQEALSKVFSPDEMAALQRAQKLLESFDKQTMQATIGSPTAERGQMLARATEVGLKLAYGGLRGGNLMRSLRLAVPNMFKDPDIDDINYLLAKMSLDPDVAIALLTRDVKEIQKPAFTKGLKRLFAIQEAGKEAGDEDD